MSAMKETIMYYYDQYLEEGIPHDETYERAEAAALEAMTARIDDEHDQAKEEELSCQQ